MRLLQDLCRQCRRPLLVLAITVVALLNSVACEEDADYYGDADVEAEQLQKHFTKKPELISRSNYRLTDIDLSCPEGWELQDANCYRVYGIERSWPQALVVCGRYGSQLVRIESSKENDFVGRLIQRQLRSSDKPDFWIGLVTQQAQETDPLFLWSDGSVVSRYAGFWTHGQPNYATGSCAVGSTKEANSFTWSLEMCNLLLPFVCQMPSCVRGSYFCLNGHCVPNKAHCDGIDDCGDLSDELNCPAAHGDAPCLKFERGESGTIQSPNYPSSYRPNANCRWVIEGPINSRIQLKFDFFETEEHSDIVHVLDGGPTENASAVIATLSGKQDVEELMLTSSTNMLAIKFRTDSLIQTRGFQATWRAVSVTCGGSLKAQPYGQTFTSPNYPNPYPNGLECVWKIAAAKGELITLDLKDIMLEPGKDFIMIYDGNSPAAPVLLRFSGVFTGSQLLISSQNHLYIYFYTNYAVSGRGFTINYKQGCDNVIRQSHGTLLSPGHTRVPYPGSQRCSYTIEVPENATAQPVALAVNMFDVLNDDFLMIFDGDEKTGKALHTGKGFGGSSRPPSSIVAQNGKLSLVFVTNPVRSGNGWNITFSTNCPPLDTPKEVSLSTTSTGFGTQVSVACPRGHEFVTGLGQQYQMTCQLGGKWSDLRIPSCQPMYCEPVPQIRNGFAVMASNVTYGGSAKYKCYEGFSFASGRDVEEIFCTDEGRWTPTPLCKAQTCPALPPFENGERKLEFGDGTGYGTVYRFECSPGYRRQGAPALLCKTNGKWSFGQPVCKKVRCYDIPEVENGMLVAPDKVYYFGESTRVVCRQGFRIVGQDSVTCNANQTFSAMPVCEDINECADGSADCIPGSTKCVNLPGGYRCDCLPGYQAQLACTIANSLGLSAGSVDESKMEASSESHEFPMTAVGSRGWCGNSTKGHGVNWIKFTFDEPKTIERIRLEKIGVDRSSFVTHFSLMYSKDVGAPLKPYQSENGTKLILGGNINGGLPGEVVVLPMSIQARVLSFHIEEYKGAPCAKMELFGCRTTNCVDINECDDNNGACEQICSNSPGSYKCACNDGYDLFSRDGQSGVFVLPDEDGTKDDDINRFNKTCIPRMCGNMTAPDNGALLATEKVFRHPMVIEFQCQFGHQMMGDSHLQCMADGSWNGTAPLCIPATCQGLQNNSAIGLFVAPDNNTIAYGQNVSILCTQQNRPPRGNGFTSFRQCVYDPQPDGRLYWLSGGNPDCPLVDCGKPPLLAGAIYDGLDLKNPQSYKVGNSFQFSCRPPYAFAGASNFGDQRVRCHIDGTWDFGDLRCEGPVCVDPGYPADGDVVLESVEEGAVAKFTCKRDGYRPFPSSSVECKLGAPCVLSEDVGVSSGFIPDGAFADNSDQTNLGYEPHKSRMSSGGWCGNKDAFIFLSVDLQRIYTLTTLRLAGVAGSGHLRGHVTKMQLFYKVQFSQNYDTYPVEFQTPPGNHNAMHQFELNPPLRARYILLGVTEYDENPCIRFDIHGCLAPLSLAQEVPLHLQVGWNASVPECIDNEPPVFRNCPSNPIYVLTDDNGQLVSANYDVPQAEDNSGAIVWMRVTPEGFKPPQFITNDMDIVYTAFDIAGNTAECTVRIRIPDTLPPVMKCPDSYVVELEDEASEYLVYFNETSVNLVVQDTSNITDLVFDPPQALMKIGTHVTVSVRAMDELGNRNKCKFQVALRPASCTVWSFPTPEKGTKNCVNRPGGAGIECTVQCQPGYQFVDEETLNKRFTCAPNGPWEPSPVPPACVAIAQEPARYELTVSVTYPVSTPVGVECLQGYTDLVATYFDRLDTTLSQRCSSSVQVFVRFLDVKFFSFANNVTANYTVQILPSVLQDVFYELCGLTLRTIFDLRIPGATSPISSLLGIPGEAVATEGVGCPTMNASVTMVSQGFGCADGEVLRHGTKTLPECLPCPKGTVFVNNTCGSCPSGSYQDETGQAECKPCPENTYTEYDGTQNVGDCLPVCGNGMASDTGMIPCDLCPRHTYSGPPIPGGFRQCEACPKGTYTPGLGSTGPSQCKLPCEAGHFSVTGLQPCSPCSVNFYQPSLGQQRCIECANATYTSKPGAAAANSCEPVDCTKVECQNSGECEVVNHAVQCRCRPGYGGALCDQNVDLCINQPCYNDAKCKDKGGDFACICAQNYTGDRCQFGPDECVGVNCPNGGVCQDLPGLGTTKCLCRTGFTGPDCSQIVDPCNGENPCKNGADCQPLKLGRFKCKCLPGWAGTTCAENIDDCAEKPCALNATCKDLVNDFQCDCPPGFSGRRCHIKENLCAQDPCVNGVCIDRLFEQQCLCQPGWTGPLCEVNINECASNPCMNNATCRDDNNAYVCQCPPGFFGSRCQHMIDHCSSSPCRNNATCTNQGASYRCACLLGFDGTHCEHNINECELLNLCGKGTQTCQDLVDGFKCQCRPGFTGEFCDVEINECASDPCLNNGTCVDGIAEFSCQCGAGWTGQRCEIESGGCERAPCQNDGKCVNLVADYFCVCPSGVDGKNCEVAPNRCIGEPCHNGGVCGDFGSRLECTCPKDYVGVGCQYELDACNAGICQNGATCNDLDNGYKCECPAGFTGTNCESNINDCSPSPCPLAASCIDQVNGYFCQCPFNMTGANCDKAINTDYDIRFYDSILPAQAGLSVPFKFSSKALTLAMWIRFEITGSRGTVFTLYSSQETNYPAKLKELMRVTSEGVRVELFDEQTPLTMQFPPNQRLNDGNWNHVVFVWSSKEGAYSLIWNAVRIFADNGYGVGKEIDINAWITLGYPVTETPNEPKFVGSVTRVNIWKRALSFEREVPRMVENCVAAPEIFDALALRWAGYNRLSGKVEKVVKSTCGRLLCPDGGDTCPAALADRAMPQSDFCPGDLYVVTPLKEVNVTWQEPTFSDNVMIDRVEHNLKPGQVFTWGDYLVLYVAYDNSSNLAQCHFKVHVSREFCPDLKDPSNGIQACDKWGPDLRFKACSVQCENGFEFSRQPPIFYACGDNGLWRPRPAGSYLFKYPQCSPSIEATRIVNMALDYPTAVTCNNAGKRTLTEKLEKRISAINKKWNFCVDVDKDGNCVGLNITISCKPKASRTKRQNSEADLYTARIYFPAKRDPLTHADTQQSSTVMDVLQNEVLLKDAFNFEQVLPSGRPDLNSLVAEDVYSCPPGMVSVDDSCVPCAAGSFYDAGMGECKLCPIGQYQAESGQVKCAPCASGLTTTGPGATVAADCKASCESGRYFNLDSGECEDCGYGFFQPNAGSFSCNPCGVGKTTLSTKSASEEECRDECADGEHLMQAGTCEKCEQGMYRTKGVHKTCTACPVGITTEGKGAIRREDCNTPRCEAGQFLVVTSKQCQLCPRATFQDEPLQTSCKLCPEDHTTAGLGATHASQCYSTNQCATGEDNCSWHAICEDLPDENDIASFTCKCKPGYRGNGTHCEDACNNFCLNDGVCKKNPVGYVECVCKENFSGERCEVRFQPKTQKVAYITGGIGGVVAILIIIVIIIWMISFRFNSKRSEEDVAESKLPPVVDGTGVEDGADSNFLYGRPVPPLNAAQNRAIGYYYEDDDEYDMKTMYINDAFDGGEKAASAAGSTNNKDEMFERLRRMNQHMYRPKQGSDSGQSEHGGDEEARTSH